MEENPIEGLKQLQRLDLEIDAARARIAEFEPLLEKVDEPAKALEKEVETASSRLKDMKLDERRLELAADERRDRMRRLEERMKTVRNLREEAAVHAELDLVRRALEADEQEALTLLDHIRQAESRLEEAKQSLQEARTELAPRRQELLEGKKDMSLRLAQLKQQRDNFAIRIAEPRRRIYESLRARGRTVVLSELTGDGACGRCYSVIPLQVQSEVRQGQKMIRCEACGVILVPGSSGG